MIVSYVNEYNIGNCAVLFCVITLRNDPEECSSQLLRGGSLKSSRMEYTSVGSSVSHCLFSWQQCIPLSLQLAAVYPIVSSVGSSVSHCLFSWQQCIPLSLQLAVVYPIASSVGSSVSHFLFSWQLCIPLSLQLAAVYPIVSSVGSSVSHCLFSWQ